jgi:hypothetical protein
LIGVKGLRAASQVGRVPVCEIVGNFSQNEALVVSEALPDRELNPAVLRARPDLMKDPEGVA